MLRRLNYLALPDSLSQVDFDPREVSEKQQYKQYKLTSKNIFRVPKPKEYVPEDLNSKQQRDPEREKK